MPSSRDAGQGAEAIRRSALLLGAVVGALALGSIGTVVHAAQHGLAIKDPWMRMVMPSRPAAGYFILSNDTSKPQTLVGAASPACGMLMLHQSVHQGGEERMAMVKSLPVPAHGTVKFTPGGYHLMCMSPSQAVRPGQSVPVTLRFADGSTVAAKFLVRGAAGK